MILVNDKHRVVARICIKQGERRMITRPGTEKLSVEPCPVCGDSVHVTDCGYSSFNPGKAVCNGCKRLWKLGFVNDQWDAGLAWNNTAKAIAAKLMVFDAIGVIRHYNITRDFAREQIEEQAAAMLGELREKVIGHCTEQRGDT